MKSSRVKRKSLQAQVFSRKLLGIILIIVLLLVSVAFFLNSRNSKVNHTTETNTLYPTVTPMRANNPLVTVIPADEAILTLKNYITDSYSLNYLSSWKLQHTVTDFGHSKQSTLLLTKGDYEIRIYRANVGGGWCVFEGKVPEGIYSDFRNTPYTQIESGIGTLRRIKSGTIYYSDRKDVMSFIFCHKNSNKNNEYTDYSTPTDIGDITYTLPMHDDEATLLEMDAIIKSLKEVR